MADRFPEFEESRSILPVTRVNSRAEGYEAFAKTLGSLAEVAEKETERYVSEESKSMLVNSVANAKQIENQARINLIENPDKARKVSEATTDALDLINKAAYVNKGDRAVLKSHLTEISNEIGIDAAKINMQYNNHIAAFTHFANFPDQLKAYQHYLLTDHSKADKLHDSIVTSLESLVSTGAITPNQAANSIKSMSELVDKVQAYHENIGNPDLTAKDYHTMTSSPLNDNNDHATLTAPVNSSTGWLMDYHNNDKTLQGVLSNIYNRVMPSPEQYLSLSKQGMEHANLAMKGMRQADGYINSGAPFTEIEHVYNNLSQKGKVLSYDQQSLRNGLGNYINNLKNGNYLEVISQTPAGHAIINDFNMRNSAIQNSPIDDKQKSLLTIQNKNKLVDEAVSYGEAHHIPYIQPIPKADVDTVDRALQFGGDPLTVLQTVGQYSKANQTYLANAMKDPNKRMVVSAVALATDLKPQDKIDFIAANQAGRPEQETGKEQGRKYLTSEISGHEKDQALFTQIYTNLSKQSNLLGNIYDSENAQELQNSMLTTTMKYAKYLAQKGGDLGMTNPTKWINQACLVYQNSYKSMSGTNWIVNENQLPQHLSHTELDILADHVTNEGYKYLMSGRSEEQFIDAVSHNTLKMVVSPTNDLLAVDANNKVYYSMPFTTNTLPYAQESIKRRKEENKRNQNGIKINLYEHFVNPESPINQITKRMENANTKQ
jgi:hypothetical protein